MHISPGLDFTTRLVHGLKPFWIEAGNLESTLLAKNIASITIDKPIFIGGLARSGSTLLLEYIAAHTGVVTHQYRDFPFIFTPYFTRKLTDSLSRFNEKRERAHGDGMMITPQSPEAMEEILWRAFKDDKNKFADFYRAHVKKLMLAMHASRYAAKNNNLTSHLPILLTLFPDARIIIPVRDPVTHIISLMRLHKRFSDAATPPIIRHLRAQAHDEFGPARHWQNEDEIAGWCAEWNRVYGQTLPYLGRENVMVVPYEALCEQPTLWLEEIASHAGLKLNAEITTHFASGITPRHYDSAITPADAERIRSLTQEINANFTNSMLS